MHMMIMAGQVEFWIFTMLALHSRLTRNFAIRNSRVRHSNANSKMQKSKVRNFFHIVGSKL